MVVMSNNERVEGRRKSKSSFRSSFKLSFEVTVVSIIFNRCNC